MANAKDVAAYILAEHGGMTAMKLQKLVYYAQAWHLVWCDRPLYGEPIEAWAAGPVIRSLFDAHRGRYTVASPADVGGDPASLDGRERETVNTVVAHYGKWTAEQLSDLTHSEEPWLTARTGLRPTERGNAVIDPTMMVDYYASVARQARV
jgi:uncharacterized phage-associated protein